MTRPPLVVLLCLVVVGRAFRKGFCMNGRWTIQAAGFLVFGLTIGLGASHALAPRFAYVANNQDDTVSIFSIQQSNLRAAGYVYTGAGSNPRVVAVTPSQSFLYVAEGNVGIAGYAINIVDGRLTPVSGSPFLTGPEFSISIHPSGKFLFAVTGSGIVVCAIDPGTGTLTSVQTVSGETPVSAAIDGKGRFLFAANVNSNSVSAFLIDQNTGAMTPISGSPFPTGPNPQSVAIERTGHFLYVPNGNGASISAYTIDQSTGALTPVLGSPFATGSIPVAVVARKSFLYVANSADKTVSQYSINPANGVLTPIAAPFPTGSSGPLALTVSPNEPLLYVADHDTDVVVVLGIRTDGTLFNESTIRTRGSPLSIALASGTAPVTYSAKFVYESNATSNDTWGYRVAPSGSLTPLSSSPFATGTSPQAVVSELRGSLVFTANAGSNNVSAFTVNPQSGALVPALNSPYPAGTQPSAIAVDNGARYVYVANTTSNTVSGYAVGLDGGLTPVPGSPVGAGGAAPRALVIDPRGKFVYVANSQSNTISVFEIDARTGALQNVARTGTGALPVAVAMPRDGKYLYALNQSSETVSAYSVDSVTGELLELTGSPFAGAVSPASMVVDPPGKRLYVGSATTVIGYRVFDTKGNLHALKQSPFAGVSVASGLSFDLADGLLYSANSSGNTVSGFQANKTNGALQVLPDSPYQGGTKPTSVTVVSDFK